jgi:putative FmdB family regulatory protein
MPIYEYQCQKCGHELEVMQRMSDPLLKDCPACGEASLKKLVSAAAFQLKGTGWYVTDFKDKGKKPADKQAASETTGGTDSAKSETKAEKPGSASPAAKSDKKAATGSS